MKTTNKINCKEWPVLKLVQVKSALLGALGVSNNAPRLRESLAEQFNIINTELDSRH